MWLWRVWLCSEQEGEAKAAKDAYNEARKIAEQKAAEFDKVRDAARGLNQELEQKASLLKSQEAEVAKLEVSSILVYAPRLASA